MTEIDATTTKTRPATMTVTNYKPLSAGAMIGTLDAELPSGVILRRCTVFSKDGKAWVAPPAKQIVGRDGTVQKTADGKNRYEAVVCFVDRATETRWSDQVIEALRVVAPEALA